jgi:dienelactone hydrolase
MGLLIACGGAPKGGALAASADPWEDGPYGVGGSALSLDLGRELRVEAWFPAKTAGAASAIEKAYLDDPDQQSTYAALLEDAPVIAEAADGPFPVVVFSHCSGCVRFSSVTAIERLVSHGFVVLAADHAGDTLFDGLAGDQLPLNTATLQLRLSDQQALLDALEAPPSGGWASVAALADLDRVGAMGHSFGSVTTGLLAQEDDRVRAALGVGAPMENPLLAGVEMESLALPLLLVLLAEDNSITEVGNELIRSNAAEPPGPAFLAEVADAGHFSVSDIAGLTEGLMPGCGEDQRQTAPGQSFTYLPPSAGLPLLGALSVAFFDEHLRGEDEALIRLDLPAGTTLTQTAPR